MCNVASGVDKLSSKKSDGVPKSDGKLLTDAVGTFDKRNKQSVASRFCYDYDSALLNIGKIFRNVRGVSWADWIFGRLNSDDKKMFENAGVLSTFPDSSGIIQNVSKNSTEFDDGAICFGALSMLATSSENSKDYNECLKIINDVIKRCDEFNQKNTRSYNSKKNLIWLYSVPSVLFTVLGAVCAYFGIKDCKVKPFVATANCLFAACACQIYMANKIATPGEQAARYRGIAMFLKNALENAKKYSKTSGESSNSKKQVKSDDKINGSTTKINKI